MKTIIAIALCLSAVAATAGSVITITLDGTFDGIGLVLAPTYKPVEYADVPFTLVMTRADSPGLLMGAGIALYEGFLPGLLTFDIPSGEVQELVGCGDMFQTASEWSFGDQESLSGSVALPDGYVGDLTALLPLPETDATGFLDINASGDIGNAYGTITSVQVAVPDAASTVGLLLLASIGLFTFRRCHMASGNYNPGV